MELLDFWKKLDLNKKPYLHPDDKDSLNLNFCYSLNNLTNYYNDIYWKDKNILHTDLIPMPYLGNLSKAKIFFLMLNPGFSFIDYYSEENSKAYRDTLVKNLNQDFSNTNFPFPFLNPEFLWTGGGQYWFKKLKSYIQYVKNKNEFKDKTYSDASMFLSEKIAILEIFPYHSISFSNHKLLQKENEIKSVEQMKMFVEKTIIPKVLRNEACIICMRQSKVWDLQDHFNIVKFSGVEARAAHISNNSHADKIIKNFLIP